MESRNVEDYEGCGVRVSEGGVRHAFIVVATAACANTEVSGAGAGYGGLDMGCRGGRDNERWLKGVW